MRTFTFRYDSKATPDNLFKRVAKAANSSVADIRRNETSSNSIHAILAAMTEGRLQTFYAIADHQPTSMYQLAQILGRDQANVLRDVKALEAMKLVTLISERDGNRDRMRPEANYDRIVFDFGAAEVSGKRKRAVVT